ncbi:uncharacterized protein LOC135472953 [Liolophura sinensis]|uniref:uncharacterized protein LOC135472953 n=1 Tax=Liolophura sinensis TaxID=3198878 RepID=UPI0031592708
MAVNFELLHSERRFRLNLESIIRKYNRPFHDDDELDLSNFEVVSDNGKLEHIEPRYFGASRLQITKRRDRSSDSAYGTASSASACDGDDDQLSRQDQYVSYNNQSVRSTLEDESWMIRYTASEKSANITAIEEIREAVAKESAEEDVDETSDADTITEDSSYFSSGSESDVACNDEIEESDGNDADLDTEEDPKDTMSKRTTEKSRSYDADIDTDSTATSQMPPSSARANPKTNPLLELLFKGGKVTQNNGSPSNACQAALKAVGKHSLDFTGVKLKPVQGNNDVVIPSSPESEEDEIITLDYDSGRPSDCPLNTTYVVKAGQDPAQQQPAHDSDRVVSGVNCRKVNLKEEPSTGESRKSVDNGHDTTLIQLGNITFDPVFNSTRNDMDPSTIITSTHTSGHHGLFFQKSAVTNSGRRLVSPLSRSKATPKTSSSSGTQSKCHPPKSKSVNVDLFMSKTSFSSEKLEEIVPIKENMVEDKTADIQSVAKQQNSQTGQQHLEQLHIIKRASNTSLDYTVLRSSENSVASSGSPASFLTSKSNQSKVKETGARWMENSPRDLVTSATHESRSAVLKTPDLLKFKKLSLNSKNGPVSSLTYNHSVDNTSERSISHSSETVCTDIQKQFDNLFYQSRPPDEIAALLSPMPIIVARKGGLMTPIHRKDASPATVLSHLKNVYLKSPLETGKTAGKFSHPTEMQSKSQSGVSRRLGQKEVEFSSDTVHDATKARLQVRSALPKLVTHTSRGLRDHSCISDLTPSLTPPKKSPVSNSMGLTKRATSTPRGKHLKNSTFDCGISTIEVNDAQNYKEQQIPSNPMECLQINCLRSPVSSLNKQAKNKNEHDSCTVLKKRCSSPQPRRRKERIWGPEKDEYHAEIRPLKKREPDDDIEGFDFRQLSNVRLSSENHDTKEKRLKLKEKGVPRREKSSVSQATMYSPDDSPQTTNGMTSPRKVSVRKKIHKKNEIDRIYELNSDESDDMSCRPLSGNSGMTFSDDSEGSSASSHSSPENSFERRIKKLRSRNRESVPARKSLAGAFRVVISSSGSGYNTELKTKRPAVKIKQSPVSSKRRLSSEDEDSEFSDLNPVPKKQRSVRKMYRATSNNNSPNTTVGCGGPGKCKKFFCFDCSDIS